MSFVNVSTSARALESVFQSRSPGGKDPIDILHVARIGGVELHHARCRKGLT